MPVFLARSLPWLSAITAVPWVVILIASGFSLVTSTLVFDDQAYYSSAIILGVAILLTTAVLMDVEARSADHRAARLREAGLLGVLAAILAIALVAVVPVWGGLLVSAVAGTVIRTRNTGLTSRGMRVVVLSGLGLFGIAVLAAGFLNQTADMVGAILWGAMVILSAVLVAWLVELAVRAARSPDPSTTAVPTPSA